ncbi:MULTISPECIES: hypothetical protein [unclassified Pseudonocardia]|uniref:hypothetical protein n=1 Tax=unclassified Pseudonocardia TaxID=2619320 RepID=UPI0001FFDE35|nr:hypothetical protein [Pseudonocardia sp. Ae707_Ps1]OLM19539.1 PE-PGRS family protein [Pseudonocardia sp. Ae707_Ps1]
MTAPDLPRVTPSATSARSVRGPSRAGLSRVRVGNLGPRLLLRTAFVGVALLVLVLLLSGCGNGELPAGTTAPATPSPTVGPTPSPSPSPTRTTPAPETTRPTTEAPPSDRSGGTGGTGGTGGEGGTGGSAPQPGAAPLLWPAGDAATAKRMQQQADDGGDPWLLDPEEVAISYVGAELGYRDPSMTELAPGRFAVTDGRSAAKSTVSLEQTVRKGPGGIWLVTRVDRY